MIRLRPYQKVASDCIFKEWESVDSTLVVMPTGTGKTVLFADIIRRSQPGRTMVLAHRKELVWQARDKIEKVTGLRADVEMGEYHSSNQPGLFHPQAQVIVSTIQTHVAGGDGGGRMSKFNPEDFSVLIIDESHRSVSPSFKEAIAHYRKNPKLKILGVTATPDRADEEALGQIFNTVAFDYEILDAIKDGWLVPVEQQLVSIEDLDISKVRTSAGDLNSSDLEAVFNQERPVLKIIGATMEIAGTKRTLGFTSSVGQAKLSANVCNRYRAGSAAWICGETDKMFGDGTRKKILDDYAANKIQFLFNCGVLVEGFDDSGIEVVSMARPTKSRSLYAQMAGRPMRPHESIAHWLNSTSVAALRRNMIAGSCKKNCLIIDFVGNSGKHKLMTTADILDGNYSDEAKEAAVQKALRVGGRVRMDKSIAEEEKIIEDRKKRELEEQARKAKLVAKVTYKTQKIDPFDVLQIKPNAPRGWDKGKVLTEGMKSVLRKMKLNPDDFKDDYAAAKTLVGEQFDRWKNGLCTFPQAKFLKERGYSPRTSFEDARKIMDAWAKNNWHRPPSSALPKSVQTGAIEVPRDWESENQPF